MLAKARLEWCKGPKRGDVQAAQADHSFGAFRKGPREMVGCLRGMWVQVRFFFFGLSWFVCFGF